MDCEQVEQRLYDHLAGEPLEAESRDHLGGCEACRTRLSELQEVQELLRARKSPAPPADLAARIHRRLAAEPAVRRFRLNWPSMAAGAVAAGLILALVTVILRQQAPLPTIQTAAIGLATPSSVTIGFNVAKDVDDVTYQIDLPDGLQFMDANNQPIQARSVTWQGSLKRGVTVVPITVRGVQPGRFEILATVRKNQFAQTTKIVVPVRKES